MHFVPGRPASPSLSRRSLLALTPSALAAGCVQGEGTDDGGSTPDPTPHPSLASGLYDLATADDLQAYAEAHGIDLEDGAVAVQVRLVDEEASVPDDLVVRVDARHGDRVDAVVRVDDLVPLADHEVVSFVGFRDELAPHDGGTP